MVLSILTLAGLSPISLALFAIVMVAGLACAGCGPSPPPKWTGFRDETPASAPKPDR